MSQIVASPLAVSSFKYDLQQLNALAIVESRYQESPSNVVVLCPASFDNLWQNIRTKHRFVELYP